MADLIERDALEAKIRENSMRIRFFDPSVNVILHLIRYAPAVNRWIPCSERLPEVYEKVLTYNDEGIIHDNFRLNLRDGSVGWSQGWGITYWQPRPEPPKEGTDNG